MDDQSIKFLIQEINSKLNKNYNLISFNEMKNDDLIQLLCESLNAVQTENKLALNNDMFPKIPEILNNIGYQNSIENEKSLGEIKKGNKGVIHPILLWIFQNFEKASLRAYLAEYLVRINVPTMYLEMPEIQQAYKNYVLLMDNFRKTHLELQKVEEDNKIVIEAETKFETLSKDIAFLNSRLSETKDKISKIPNSNIAPIETLWNEFQNEEEMNRQLEEQQTVITKLDSEYSHLQEELQSLQNETNSNPITSLQEQLNQNSAKLDKFTRLLNGSQKKIEILRQVVNFQDVAEDDLNDWRERIDDVQAELQELEIRKRQQIDPLSDRLAPYRKELSAIGENQNKIKATLNRNKMAYQLAEKTMIEKQAAVNQIIGHEVKRGPELKEYIQKLREKNQLVDYYKEIVAGMKAEHEVQLRTMEILTQKHPDLKSIFDKRNKEVVKVEPVSIPNSNSVSEVVQLCKQTKMIVDSSKAQLSAYMQEIIPLREGVKINQQKLAQLQKDFEDEVGGLKHELEIANREVESIKSELKRKEDQWKTLQREIQHKEETFEKIEMESKDVEISTPQKQLLENQLESLQIELNHLNDQKTQLESSQGEREKICKSWNTVKTLLEIKKRNREANNKKVQKIGRTEILTL